MCRQVKKRCVSKDRHAVGGYEKRNFDGDILTEDMLMEVIRKRIPMEAVLLNFLLDLSPRQPLKKINALRARVSTWKQRIEKNLDQQDAQPPFDIHEYGQWTSDKLSQDADVGNAMTFTYAVRGPEKHEVARTFSTLLQLVE
uniref:Condensin-2 complex subunit H2 n=1 Tax=Tanacetum cinerariifolium TaxID=118510 RepID=A0A6L2LVP4_TANCI|nr:condensin-2 complex subunit H2 [Tanacetum cinerariifolium]